VILSKLFWDGRNMIFLVEHDRVKCKEHIGKNEIEIGFANKILRSKTEKRVSSVLHGWHGCVSRWHDRVWTFWLGDTALCTHDTTVSVLQYPETCFFVFLCTTKHANGS